MPTALIVDDEPDIRTLLEITLERMGLRCVGAAGLESARACLANGAFELCLTDMRLPDGDGLDLVAHISRHHPDLPVAVITAHGNMEAAVQALKSGAFDFLSKPLDIELLRRLVRSALRLSEGGSRATRLVGEAPPVARLRATVAKLARSQAPVLITGESGTGKELVARMIHEGGPRADRPFVPVNCGAIPQELMESEFFGHRKGSFTGALSEQSGLFQSARGGTLFLDELAELPVHMQVKLLRAIQEKAVRPVGAAAEVPVDCRILSASNVDLAARVADGRFRQDLYYRINVIELRVPPLRERRADIPLLVRHILARLAAQAGLPAPDLDPAALAALEAHPFPGNVRELENVLERAFTLCETTRIGPGDLRLNAGAPSGRAQPSGPAEPPGTAPAPAPARAAPAAPGGAPPLESDLHRLERERILAALEQTRWNKTAAARLLGISFRALRYRLAKLELEGRD